MNKSTLIIPSYFLLLFLVSCARLPEDLSERKEAVDRQIDSLENLSIETTNLKDVATVMGIYQRVVDTLTVLSSDAEARGVKTKFKEDLEKTALKQQTIREKLNELQEKVLIGTWGCELTDHSQFEVTFYANKKWETNNLGPGGFLGKMQGRWEGVPSVLYCSTFGGGSKASASMTDDGTVVWWEFIDGSGGSQLPLEKRR